MKIDGPAQGHSSILESEQQEIDSHHQREPDTPVAEAPYNPVYTPAESAQSVVPVQGDATTDNAQNEPEHQTPTESLLVTP